MTRRERVRAAINHLDTDIIPYNIDCTNQEYEKVAEYLKDQDFLSKIGNHIESVYYSGIFTEDTNRPGYFTDDFGVVWNRNGADKDIGVIDNYMLPEAELGEYNFPEIPEKILNDGLELMMCNGKDTFKTCSLGFSMFERAWTLRGMENLLTDMLLEPEFVEELLNKICDFNMKIIDIGLKYDIDAFYFGDDWGQQSGLIMGPKLWRKFIKPQMARMYEKVRKAGKFVLQHSCGDIQAIFPDLIEIGLNVYQTFQPEIYDIKEIKRLYGKDLTFWGGISTQRLLPFGTPKEVKNETMKIMKFMGRGGGYIAGPTHAVPGDVPTENMVALMDVFMNQEKWLRNS
ncbi:MAG TPA: uroporphyrinogen decarboxylase family protein [Clostridiaceae bacterium]